MRYIFGILFVIFFGGFLACTIMFFGPPREVYALRDNYLYGALVCAVSSAVVLGILAFGIGAKGKKISVWRVPLLCALSALANLGIGGKLLAEFSDERNTFSIYYPYLEVATNLKICAWAMVVLGLFSLGCLIVALISAKRSNSKISIDGVMKTAVENG